MAAGNLPSSIVVRTTLSILGLSMLLGLIFAMLVAGSVQKHEYHRAEVHLQELLSTVESTARIACFLKDAKLAAEIGQGLMRNRGVAGVRITAAADTLYSYAQQQPRAAADGQSATLARNSRDAAARGDGFASAPITRIITSPFDAQEQVGEISLYVAESQIHEDAAAYSRDSTLLLALQAALVAAGVAAAVYFFVTQPLRTVSKELHKSRQQSGTLLSIPPRNRFDELGSMVHDANALIGSLTSLVETERELRIQQEIAERRMRLIFEKAESGIVVLEGNGVLQSWNPAFGKILGLKGGSTPRSGVTRLQELLAAHAVPVGELIAHCLTSGEPQDLDLEIETPGRLRSAWIEISLNPVGPGLLEGIINDISERKRVELSAVQRATHDSLTGLLNRHGLEAGLATLITRDAGATNGGSASAAAAAFLMIDLDHFKQVNDTYGHEAGDRVLRHVATILERSLRRADLIARPGGDEFVAALVGMVDTAKALQLARLIISEVSQPIDIGAGRCARIGASIGVAVATAEDTLSSLAGRADAAMYAAKESGRGQACLAPPPTPQASAAA